MTAADISSTMTTYDAVPNDGMKIKLVTVTSTENDDYIDMASDGYASVLWAVALVSNATEACEISDDTVITFSAGGTDAITLLVVGV